MSMKWQPWTGTQVAWLNRLQDDPLFHGYTCRVHSDRKLIAHTDGWHCTVDGCPYRQGWADMPESVV